MTDALPVFDLDTYLPYQLTVLADRLSRGLAQRYKARFDISIPEWRVLVNVGYSDNPSVREIERRVSLEKSKVSRAASRLETKGYLVKQVADDDRRLLKLALTPKGIDLLKELIPMASEFQDEVRAYLGPQNDELAQALSTLMERTT